MGSSHLSDGEGHRSVLHLRDELGGYRWDAGGEMRWHGMDEEEMDADIALKHLERRRQAAVRRNGRKVECGTRGTDLRNVVERYLIPQACKAACIKAGGYTRRAKTCEWKGGGWR